MEYENEVQITFLNENEKRKDRKENEQRKKDKNNSYTYYIIGLRIFVCLNVFLLTSIIVTVCYMESVKKKDILDETEVCVPCKDIIIHPDEDIEGIVRKGKNNEIYCVEDRETSDVLVGYFVDHWLKAKLSKENRHFTRYKCKDDNNSSKSKPAIKLVGLKENQTAGHDTVIWNSLSDDAILSGSMDIFYDEQRGFIEVKKAGLYQIYTQVVLNHDKITKELKLKDTPYIHQHFVIRTEAGREQGKIILKSSNSYCSCKTKNQTVTSYVWRIPFVRTRQTDSES